VVSGFSRIDGRWRDVRIYTGMIPLHPQPFRDFDYIGPHYYSLTWCCNYRQRLFAEVDRVDLVRAQFLRAGEEAEFDNIAYCFMPDHVHKVIKGRTSTSDAKQYIKLAKQYSGYYYKQAFGTRLWQRYGYDRIWRRDNEPKPWVAYAIENPVRAGLTTKAADHPFTGSSVYSMQELIQIAYSS
jgi:putative transposase